MKTTFLFALGTALFALATMNPGRAASPPPAQPPAGAPRIEVCFVLDTTGSMGGLIEAAKQKIWSIANQIVKAKPAPQLKIGLVAYRDRGDVYITKPFPLTDDIDTVYANLMQFQADGEQSAKRRALQKEIGDLAKQREDYLAEQRRKLANAADSFDAQVAQILREEARGHGLSYN